MNQLQFQVERAVKPNGERVVVPFRPRNQPVWSLSTRDRLDLARWHDRIQASGHREIVHEREPGDSSEVGSFLSLYRAGDPWSVWNVSRLGETLSVWCGRTCKDVGRYASMREVLQALLAGCAADPAIGDPAATGTLISLCRVS